MNAANIVIIIFFIIETFKSLLYRLYYLLSCNYMIDASFYQKFNTEDKKISFSLMIALFFVFLHG